MPRARPVKEAQGGTAAAAALAAAIEVVETLPLPVFIKDRDGLYLAVNRAWEDFFGVSRAGFLGKRVAELYPQDPAVAAKHMAMDRELWRSGGSQSYEVPLTVGAGKGRIAVFNKSIFGGGAGLIGVIVDVTGRKEAEERLRAGFEYLGEMVALTDADDRIVVANRRFREFNAAVAECVEPGRRYEEHLRVGALKGLFPASAGREEEWIAERMAQRRNPTGPLERARQDGRWLLVDDQRLPDGGAVTFGIEITERKRAEQALRESEERYRRTFEVAGTGIAHIGPDRRFLRVNRRLCEILGYSEQEMLQLTGRQISHPDDLDVINSQRPALYAGEIDEVRVEKRYLRKDGQTVWVAFTMVLERDAAGRPAYEIAIYDDITARRDAETAMRESEERFRAVVDAANDGILVYDRSLNVIAGNAAAERIIGLPLAKIVGAAGFTSLLPCVKPDGSPLLEHERPTRITARSGANQTGIVVGVRRDDGSLSWLSINTAFLRHPGAGDWHGIVSTVADITAQRNAELALRESEARFRQTFELAAAGIAHVIDGRFVRANRSLCEILGYDEGELIGKSVKQISHPQDRDVTDAQRARIVRGELESARFEKRYLRKDGTLIWAEIVIALVRDAGGKPLYEIAIFDDITERKRAEAALNEAHHELKRSNAELEQFAYVASHDLQEPLRMVSSYTQLVMRRYSDRLDKDAHEFMHYVVDGAARMKQLIEDLLAYSRVGTKGKGFQPVALEAPLQRALANLKSAIEQAGAAITWDPLPVVQADESQLAQLFQNLVGNALKFRGPSVPRIHVSGSDRSSEWEIAVADNGIGIEPQYYERIFMVFQRLHNKAEYPGTGIGLAICKKVVERHGGRMWVESQPGRGSTFHFTLPRNGKPHG